jgi:hypothetical protein
MPMRQEISENEIQSNTFLYILQIYLPSNINMQFKPILAVPFSLLASSTAGIDWVIKATRTAVALASLTTKSATNLLRIDWDDHFH